MTEQRTDPRLLGIEQSIATRDLGDTAHANIEAYVRTALSDYRRAPTLDNLHVLVSELLTYQESAALGRRRTPHGVVPAENPQSRGGKNAAAAMTPEQRTQRSRDAARARWAKEVPA